MSTRKEKATTMYKIYKLTSIKEAIKPKRRPRKISWYEWKEIEGALKTRARAFTRSAFPAGVERESETLDLLEKVKGHTEDAWEEQQLLKKAKSLKKSKKRSKS